MRNKIVYYKGDVIEAAMSGKYDVFIHGCNTKNIMGAGVAAQVKEKMTHLWRADCDAHEKGENFLGGHSVYYYKTLGLSAHNLYTQDEIGTDSIKFSYGAFVEALHEALFYDLYEPFYNANLPIEFRETWHICMPRVGCGLAGGHWPVVEDLLTHIDWLINKKPIEFHVYDL